MAKRFSDTDKWKKQWYRNLTPASKCFWHYIFDNSGIWEIDKMIPKSIKPKGTKRSMRKDSKVKSNSIMERFNELR